MTDKYSCDQIVDLRSGLTQINPPENYLNAAVESAMRVTLSDHEHVWTQEEQRSMAYYVMWARQRLSAIEQCCVGPLEHSSGE